MLIKECISIFRRHKIIFLILPLFFSLFQFAYLFRGTQMFYKDIAVITYSEQFNEDLIKLFHSNSILASAIDTTSIDVNLQKQSTFLFNIKLSSKNPDLLEKTEGIVRILETSADNYFQQKKQHCLHHLELTSSVLKAYDKTSKPKLLELFSFINNMPYACSVFFSFDPVLINKVSFRKDQPDFAELYTIIESELTKVKDHIQNAIPAKLNIVIGTTSQNIITKADLLRLIYSYLIVFLGSIVLVFFVRENKS